MRNTDEDERPNDSAPQKIPGALTPPVPWDGNPAPMVKAEAAENSPQPKSPTPVTSGFGSFEG